MKKKNKKKKMILIFSIVYVLLWFVAKHFDLIDKYKDASVIILVIIPVLFNYLLNKKYPKNSLEESEDNS